MRKLIISGKWIRVKPAPTDLLLNILGGKKVAKIYDMDTARNMVAAYNKEVDKFNSALYESRKEEVSKLQKQIRKVYDWWWRDADDGTNKDK
jgi:hypothetical protein